MKEVPQATDKISKVASGNLQIQEHLL